MGAAVTTAPGHHDGEHADPAGSYLENTHSLFKTHKGVLGWVGTLGWPDSLPPTG